MPDPVGALTPAKWEKLFDLTLDLARWFTQLSENRWDDYLVPALEALRNEILGLPVFSSDGPDGLPDEVQAKVSELAAQMPE